MEKARSKSLCAMHLLILSAAVNVGLLLRMTYVQIRTKAHVSSKESEKAHVSKEVKTKSSSHSFEEVDDGRIINFDQGDPTMYERYWKEVAGEKGTIVIPAWQAMSYYSDPTSLCWFMEPELVTQITRLHRVVGNAVTEGRHLVVGTGVTQLFQAALHALAPDQSSSDDDRPLGVVCAAPYYSFYKNAVDHMQSRLYKWVGDVSSFNGEGPFIEVVTSPNNPDGFMRQPMLKNHTDGDLIHDFAYYWPQYTPITSPADHDIMLFTASKITGHAGTRIGWAIVKNKEVAERMTKFVVMSSIGVSKDSQLRTAKILSVVSDTAAKSENGETLFEFGHQVMENRWRQLREVVSQNELFSIPEFPSAYCNYFKRSSKIQPAFAWVKYEGDAEDCEALFKAHNILTRSGRFFGVSPRFVRISMLDRDIDFNLFLKRLGQIHH